MKKGVDEKIDESTLPWFGHIDILENNGIAKRVQMHEKSLSELGRP